MLENSQKKSGKIKNSRFSQVNIQKTGLLVAFSVRKRKDIENDVNNSLTERKLQKIKIEIALDIREQIAHMRKDFKKIFHK